MRNVWGGEGLSKLQQQFRPKIKESRFGTCFPMVRVIVKMLYSTFYCLKYNIPLFQLLFEPSYSLILIFWIGLNWISLFQVTPRKILWFLLTSWCGIIVVRQSFRRSSGESPETLRKLCLSTKFPHHEIRWNHGILRRVTL